MPRHAPIAATPGRRRRGTRPSRPPAAGPAALGTTCCLMLPGERAGGSRQQSPWLAAACAQRPPTERSGRRRHPSRRRVGCGEQWWMAEWPQRAAAQLSVPPAGAVAAQRAAVRPPCAQYSWAALQVLPLLGLLSENVKKLREKARQQPMRSGLPASDPPRTAVPSIRLRSSDPLPRCSCSCSLPCLPRPHLRRHVGLAGPHFSR